MATASEAAPPEVLGTFDYVIVGAGPSAMGLLLGLLQQKRDSTQRLSIALIERGNAEEIDPLIAPLHRWGAASHPSWINHSRSAPSNAIIFEGCLNASDVNEKGSVERVLDVSTGIGLGGSTLINAGLVIPPSSQDFLEWPSSVKDSIMASVAAIVETMHSNHCIAPSFPSPPSLSPLPIVPPDRPWTELQFPSCCLDVPCSVRKTPDGFVRASYFESLLLPLLGDDLDEIGFRSGSPRVFSKDGLDLSIWVGHTVQRLILSTAPQPIATAVEVLQERTGRYLSVVATREIILCAGSIHTPAILLASGIGLLQTLPTGVDSASKEAARAPVGRHLKDHVLLPRILLGAPDTSAKRSLNGVRAMANYMVHKSPHDGKVTTTKVQVSLMDSAAFWDVTPLMVASALRFRSDPAAWRNYSPIIPYILNLLWDALFHSIHLLLHVVVLYTPVYYLLHYYIKVMAVFVMNAESIGSMTVSRKVPPPNPCRVSDLNVHIHLGYLTHTNDIQRFMTAFQVSTEVYQDPPSTGRWEVFPGPLVRNFLGMNHLSWHPQRFALFARAFVRPYFHWMGTCKMIATPIGATKEQPLDDDWVVDDQFRVRGVKHLRICDASIFPTLISAPTAVTCAALGHLLVSLLSKQPDK
jgi:choline dehydrogenase-like flavoprotein